MLKTFVFISLLILTLQARQNPFFPSEGEVDIPYTSNANTKLSSLKRASVSVPSQARVIKKVTVEYLNLDGTTSTSSISLNNAIDWHLPVFVSQNMGNIETTINLNDKNVEPLKSSTKKESYEKLYGFDFISFYKKDKEFKVETKDKIIRSFLLTSPHRIVMDFKRDLDMKSKFIKLNSKYYKQISFGVHKGYYRIVLELDGVYRYKKEKKEGSYSFYLY